MSEEKRRLLWSWRHHQDNLIHARLGWSIATQSFLLIAFANTLAHPHPTIALVAGLIPWLGLISTAVMMVSIASGIYTFSRIRLELHSESDDDAPRFGRNQSALSWLGFLPALVTPVLFILFWAALLLWQGAD